MGIDRRGGFTLVELLLVFEGIAVLFALLLLSGCGSGKLPVVKVEGKVLHQGEPLEFGTIEFKPLKGPIAKARIQPDGTFVLGTYTENDGAVLGMHQVQVRCYASQDPNSPPEDASAEPSLGKSLIHTKYTRFITSGLRADVAEENEPIVIELK